MTTFFFSDTFRLHKVVDGVKVATYTPPGVPETGGDPGLVYTAPDGQGGIFGFGIPPVTGGQIPVGWRLDADLNVTDDAWGASGPTGEWTLPNGNLVTQGGSSVNAFDGPGCVVDPDTGAVYYLCYWREWDALGNQIAEKTIAKFTREGEMVDLLLDSTGDYPGFGFIDFGGVSSGGRGAVFANGKIYAILGYYNQAGLMEYDPATQEVRIAFRCFDFTNQPIDLAFDNQSGLLWMIDRYTSGGTYGRTAGWLHAYGMDIETDIPWGTDQVDATWTVLRPLFDGNSETGPYDDVRCFAISNGVGLLETNNVDFLYAWYTFDLASGPLTEVLVHTDNLTDPYYYYGTDVWILAEATGQLKVKDATAEWWRQVPSLTASAHPLRVKTPSGWCEVACMMLGAGHHGTWLPSLTVGGGWVWDAGVYQPSTFEAMAGNEPSLPAGAQGLWWFVVPESGDLDDSPGGVGYTQPWAHYGVGSGATNGTISPSGATPSATHHLWVVWYGPDFDPYGTDPEPPVPPSSLVPASFAADGTG